MMRRCWVEAVAAAIAIVLIVAIAMVMSGCAFNVAIAGGRALGDAPMAKSPKNLDSTDVQQLHDTDGLTPGQADLAADVAQGEGNTTRAGGANQIMQVGGNAANARSTDTSMAEEQSTAAGRETGSVDASGDRTQDRSLNPAVNVGPAGGASVDVQRENVLPEVDGDDGAMMRPLSPGTGEPDLPVGPHNVEELAARAQWLERELRRTLNALDIVTPRTEHEVAAAGD